MTAVRLTYDRSISVPQGAIVRTGYVRIDRIVLGCRERMAVGDVSEAYQRQLQQGSSQSWPPPVIEWEQDAEDGTKQARIIDGRHEYIAALMLGKSHLFVAWLEVA